MSAFAEGVLSTLLPRKAVPTSHGASKIYETPCFYNLYKASLSCGSYLDQSALFLIALRLSGCRFPPAPFSDYHTPSSVSLVRAFRFFKPMVCVTDLGRKCKVMHTTPCSVGVEDHVFHSACSLVVALPSSVPFGFVCVDSGLFSRLSIK